MKTIVAAVASTLLAGAAYAQSPASPTPAMMKADARHDAQVEKHIKDLHAKLRITPEEETQWDAVVTAMRDNATEIDAAIDKSKAMNSSGTAVDDLNAYGDVAQTHADAVKKLSAAFAPLYASMSDPQKHIADEVFAHRTHDARAHDAKKHEAKKEPIAMK